MELHRDFLIIGSGIAGLRAAAELAGMGEVLILTKAEPREGNTGYAQGGIAAAVGAGDSPELHAAAGRVHHRLGEPERALELYRRARSLRPDRWETVAAGVELALDLGDAAAAHHTWWADANLLRHADGATRTHLNRRLAAARAQPDFSLLHSLLDPGVFPDEP